MEGDVGEAGVFMVPLEAVLGLNRDKATLHREARGDRLDVRGALLGERGESKCFRTEAVKEGARDVASKAGAGSRDW